MSNRPRHINVPTEIARTVLTVQEVGSLTKAAHILGVTQPAISSQLRRLETLVGGRIFAKTANGSFATELGISVLQQCRKMIEANDHLLAIGGVIKNDRLVRLGLSLLLVRSYLLDPDRTHLTGISLHCDNSPVLAARLLDGQLDIACVLDGNGLPSVELQPFVRHTFSDELVWVRSQNFVLTPGAPIPIITWAGGNDPMTRALTARSIAYRAALIGGDFDTKKMAVEAGLGLTCLPKRHVPPNLVVADDCGLPELPAVTGLLCVGANVDLKRTTPVVERLAALFFSDTQSSEARVRACG